MERAHKPSELPKTDAAVAPSKYNSNSAVLNDFAPPAQVRRNVLPGMAVNQPKDGDKIKYTRSV